MRKFLLLLGPLFATSALYACESESGSSSSGSVTPFEAGGVDAPVTPMQDGALPDNAVPDSPVGPLPVTVLVNGLDGKPKADIDVVFHDTNGAVVAQAKTAATGQASSPAGMTVGMASALLGNAVTKTRHVITWAGVKSGDVLVTTDVEVLNESPVGSYAVTYPAAPGTPTAYEAYMGTCYAFQQGGGPGTMTLPVYASCVRQGNTNNIVVRALNGNADIGYAFVKNLAPASGVTPVAATTNAFATPGTFTVIASNRPQQNFGASIELAEIAGTQLTFNRFSGFFGTESSSTVFNGVATAYAEGFQVFSSRRDNPSEHRIIQRFANGTSATLDYGQQLPNILTRTLDNTDYKRPKLSWTTAAPGLGSTDGGVVTIRWSGGDESTRGWTIIVPPNALDAKFPALPATATDWLPPDPGDGGRPRLFQPEVMFVESDLVPNADDFRKQAGIVLPLGRSDVLSNVVMPKIGKLRVVRYYEDEG